MVFNGNNVLVKKNDYRVMGTNENDREFEFIPLRDLIPFYKNDELDYILKEYQHENWKKRHKFCGVCGSKTNFDSLEGCSVCSVCNEKYFPALFPAVIISITKGDEILLAHNKNFTGDMHSVIAGFVDIGESLEEAVAREIMEEVGIKVKNITYFSSQNWGFTSSLMIAFKAEYESGDITVDGIEIDKAGWYKKDNLPEIPPSISIARGLIDEFTN